MCGFEMPSVPIRTQQQRRSALRPGMGGHGPAWHDAGGGSPRLERV